MVIIDLRKRKENVVLFSFLFGGVLFGFGMK